MPTAFSGSNQSQFKQGRGVRVFVSSTFRDMREERDYLVKFIFPELRKLCKSRCVTWCELDLRWGVTDEQKTEGRVLPICLEEIHRCRPYFIGLLGERYGWVPDRIPADLFDQHPWLRKHQGLSVTELEITHGVLQNPATDPHAYVYFRDPAYLVRLPPGANRADFECESDIARQKLARLKHRVREAHERHTCTLRENYRDPQELGRWVLKDFTELINRLFPAEQNPDPLDSEAAEHEAFAMQKAAVHVGRQECYKRLDAHAQGDGPPLVILGESGVGKSALLASWGLRYRTSHPADHVLMHFIGASVNSAHWAATLGRVMGELKRRFGIEQDVPDTGELVRWFSIGQGARERVSTLRAAFAEWLRMVPERVVIVLDGLDGLEDRDGALGLPWLPSEVPGNVRLVLSTLPGRPLHELENRRWPVLNVEPLSTGECAQLITEYLTQYKKGLSPSRVAQIAGTAQAANPLYLCTLLEELRIFGVWERLDERIGHYLGARTIPGLYERVMERCEEDYEGERQHLVRDSMTLLWAARHGLPEADVLDLLGSEGKPLPRAHWTPLQLAVERSLVVRTGRVALANDYLRQAVEHRYLRCDADRKKVHLQIADRFLAEEARVRRMEQVSQQLGGNVVILGREALTVDEFLCQLARAEAWHTLREQLAHPALMHMAYCADRSAVQAHWAQIERHCSVSVADVYRPLIEAPTRYAPYEVECVADLLMHLGYLSQGLPLQQFLVERYRQDGDLPHLANALNQVGLILRMVGQADAAFAAHKEQEGLCRRSRDRFGLQACLGNQGVILYECGYLEHAMKALKEQEEICLALDNRTSLAISLGNQALVFIAAGNRRAAMPLLKRGEQLCRESCDDAELQRSLLNQAGVLQAEGDLDGAEALYRQIERSCAERGDKGMLHIILGNRGSILADRGDIEGAMALYGRQEQLCRDLGDQANLASCLGNQALIRKEVKDLDGALALLAEQERICRSLGNRNGLRQCLINQAQVYTMGENWERALAAFKEEERVCRELDNQGSLACSLANQAMLLGQKLGRAREGLPLAEEAYRLATAHGYPPVVRQIEPILNSLRQALAED